MDYARSSILITGASKGIGRNIAVTFAKMTTRPLLLISRDKQGLQETQNMCLEAGGEQVKIIICDLTDEKQVASIRVPDSFPAPGILINNAGSYLLKGLSETSHEEFLEQVQSNLFTAVHTTNRFLDKLKGMDRALIVNICSVGSLEGLKESGAYSAAKHALLGYTRSLRKELINTTVGVTAINLGQTQSTSWEGSNIDRNLLIDPRDVARLIVTLTQLSPRTLAEEIVLKPQHGRVSPM